MAILFYVVLWLFTLALVHWADADRLVQK